MTLKEDIDKQYFDILKISKEYDSLFKSEKTTSGWEKVVLKKNLEEKYWELREKLETDIPNWMQLIRKSIGMIPQEERAYSKVETDGPYGEPYEVKVYENTHFSSVMGFFQNIRTKVETGCLGNIKGKRQFSSSLRDIQSDVLSLSNTLEIFVPEKMISIQKQVKIIFKLRELGMEEIASQLEEIDNEKDSIKRCLIARTSLEKIVAKFCKDKNIEVKKGFYTNLDNAIVKGLTEKKKRIAIAGHYSFVSKIVHGDINADSKNAQYAVDGILNIISSII